MAYKAFEASHRLPLIRTTLKEPTLCVRKSFEGLPSDSPLQAQFPNSRETDCLALPAKLLSEVLLISGRTGNTI